VSLTIKDRLEIQDLIVRYAYAKDLGDESDLLSIFTDTPVLESGVTGRRTGVEVLRDMARRDQEKRKTYRLRHAVSNFRIEGDGDRATLLAYFVEHITWTEPSRPHSSHGLEFVGHYDCDVRRIDGKWLIERRAVHADGHP
jgi:hypothetical protein